MPARRGGAGDARRDPRGTRRKHIQRLQQCDKVGNTRFNRECCAEGLTWSAPARCRSTHLIKAQPVEQRAIFATLQHELQLAIGTVTHTVHCN
jgi:hypothetical protein